MCRGSWAAVPVGASPSAHPGPGPPHPEAQQLLGTSSPGSRALGAAGGRSGMPWGKQMPGVQPPPAPLPTVHSCGRRTSPRTPTPHNPRRPGPSPCLSICSPHGGPTSPPKGDGTPTFPQTLRDEGRARGPRTGGDEQLKVTWAGPGRPPLAEASAEQPVTPAPQVPLHPYLLPPAPPSPGGGCRQEFPLFSFSFTSKKQTDKK